MKKIVFSILLLAIIQTVFSQETNTSAQITKQDYIKKGKTQKIAAWSFLGGGLAMTIGGIAINASQPWYLFGTPPSDYNKNKGLGLAVVGIVATLGSIPLFISSAKNKKRAKSIVFNNQDIYLPTLNGFAFYKEPVISFQIHF
jgi:hypothetical protein